MESTRRNFIKSGAMVLASNGLDLTETKKKPKHQFKFCLNTSTIREQKLGLMGELDVTAKAGYDAIEIWISTLQSYVDKGGKLADVRKKAQDLNLTIADAIGFAKWIVDDKTDREKALEQAKREMGMLAQIGCNRVAAPPFGAQTAAKIDLRLVAERYSKLLEIGISEGVIPQLEVWGFSTNIQLMGEASFILAECNNNKAAVLSDVYHIHKGGSNTNSLSMLSDQTIQIFHVNDYPKEPPRELIKDGDRIFPGDGVAPLQQIFNILHAKNSPIILSLELFNETYWKMDAFQAAKSGLDKMKAAVMQAIS